MSNEGPHGHDGGAVREPPFSVLTPPRGHPESSVLARPRAVLFDLDGTLIDSIELIVRSFEHATTAHLGAPLSRESIIPTIGRSLAGEMERIAPGRGAELVATYRTYMLANHDALVTVYPGVLEMLVVIRARGIPTGIVTSKAQVSAAPSFERFLLHHEMTVIVTYDDTERHKPEPDPLLHAARLLDLPPAACWYVGDSTHDMVAARAAGMTGIGALWGPYPRAALEPLADTLAETPADVLALIADSGQQAAGSERERR